MSGDPKRLQEMMAAAFGRPELVRLVRARRIWERWPEIVGDTLAKKCAPSRYESGTLWITVSGASWAQELRMQKHDLLAKLNREESVFKELRFVVGVVEPMSRKVEDAKEAAIEPEEVDVNFEITEIEEVGRRALGRMKALSRKRDVAPD